MLTNVQTRRRLGAIAAACLLSVALPATTALAQKSKSKGADAPATETASTSMSSSFSVDIPGIESIDSNVDEATIRAIFSGELADNAEALAGLSATSISIPVITIEASTVVDGEESGATITFSDFVLSDVADGVAASVTVGGMSMKSSEGDGEFGAMSASNFDIGGVLGMYGLVGTSGSGELETIYTDFTFEGGTLVAPEVECEIGAMSAAEFKARPLAYSFSEVMAMAEAMEADGEEPSPENVGMFLRMYADILTAFESSPVSFDGLSCTGVDDDGRNISFSMAGMEMGGMAPGLYPAISMEGLEIAVEGDGVIGLGSATFKAMDLSGPIATILSAPDAVDEAWFIENARALVPAFEGFAFSNLDIDIPDEDNPGERIVASVGEFDLTLGAYLNGIPTDVDTFASNIVVDLPEDSSDEQLQQLLALGITSIDAGFAFDANWNADDSTISIDELSISGADLATVVVAGTIANATEALFASDENEMMAAAMGVAIASLGMDITDAGLSDIILAQVAAEQGSDAATMRPVFAGLAEGTIVGLLAGVADAQKIGGAISAFVSGQAKNLSVTLTAKEAPGIGMMDLMAAEQDPTVLLGKVTIDASAN